jgi:LSD1 subclass zinc finger protein
MLNDFCLIICGPCENPDYPGGQSKVECSFCGTVLYMSKVNYARVRKEGLPIRIGCAKCAGELAKRNEIVYKGVLTNGRIEADNMN